MFYHKNWDKFCSAVVKTNATSMRASDITDHYPGKQFIVFKHDVETNPSKALKLAQIENKHGIKGSFYVQAYLLNNPEHVKILQQIKHLGHEVSYHYDVLDANNGNFEKANIEFQQNLKKFEAAGFEIKTVCQHGNPVKNRIGYTSNRDFFRKKSIAEQYNQIRDIVVNFKKKTGTNYLYISDAGYAWNIISDPENNDRVKDNPDIKLRGFEEIVSKIDKGHSIILSTHPHRWHKSKIGIYLKISLFKTVRLTVKFLTKIPGIKNVLNHFYFLAKKI
ncbi:MAG: hypothetical protein PF590_07505 [Candidatus Delongbacteria bacterium]|jgi:hypothetical protein|nr:hypothetical protein [Candidatus Delongbacteria bacterium]